MRIQFCIGVIMSSAVYDKRVPRSVGLKWLQHALVCLRTLITIGSLLKYG